MTVRTTFAGALVAAKARITRISINRLARNGFPSVLLPMVKYLATAKCSADIRNVTDTVEAIRSEVAAGGDSPVEILYSPRPGTSGAIATEALRPAHGEPLSFTMRQIAATGKNARWGTALHILARTARAERILELGSCAGISGCYLTLAPDCIDFVTIEGSQALARLAKANLDKVSDNSTVYNLLFDDALDLLLPEMGKIDFAFIDGHHEKVATIHYWQRISRNMAPDAIVVFDDVSWSADMREAWEHLSRQSGFSHCVDLGSIGVGVCERGARPRYWDLQDIVGRRAIGTPRGWK